MRTGFRLLFSGCLVATLLAFALPAGAREAVTAPVRWTDSRGAPDELPRLVSAPKATVPEELVTSGTTHYVFSDFILDTRGRVLSLVSQGTLPQLERPEPFGYWKFEPARRDGKPVNSQVTLARIFPPADAGRAEDQPPRLLEVTRVILPRPALARPGQPVQAPIVHALVSVDPSGAVSDVRGAPDEYLAAMRRTARAWRFAPARRDGTAVASEISLPFVFSFPDEWRKPDTLPRVLHRAAPQYPSAMVRSGLRGEVVVDFVVDIEGRTRDAHVVRTLNPAFDDFALDAVRQWRFEPGRIGDYPVPVKMQVPILFSIRGQLDGGQSGLEVTRKADLSKLPPELRYDTPPKIIGMERVVYPYFLLAAGRSGRATVHYVIHESGSVEQAEVREATDPEFGAALLAAVERFRFEPALQGGRAIKAVAAFSHEFTRDVRHQVVSETDLRLLEREKKTPGVFASLAELDTPLVPVSRKPPIFPVTETTRREGEATIEFLVDEEGRARLPRTISATSPAFAHAAIVAIATWRFEPPLRAGEATEARVQIPLQFTR